jgi:hypothetical protein
MTGALVFLAPFIWMVLTSLKPVDEIFTRELTLLPTRLALVENYTEALTRVPLLRYLWNGIVVCAAILVLQSWCCPGAYAFACWLRAAGAVRGDPAVPADHTMRQRSRSTSSSADRHPRQLLGTGAAVHHSVFASS